MSESEIVSSSLSKKKLMNAQTQHGNESTADEENIVVLARSCSPVREESEEVVWHEELTVNLKRSDDDEDVSFFI